MQLAVDLSTVRFAAAGQSRPHLDYTTKTQKLDDQGQPLYEVRLFVIGAGDPEAITVRVPGDQKSLAEFQPVRVHGLTATTWSMGERSGVTFRATKVEAAPATSPRPAS